MTECKISHKCAESMLWRHYDRNWGISAIRCLTKNNRLLAIIIEFKRKQDHPSKVQYYNVLKILKPECPTPFAMLHSGEHNLITYCLGEQKQIRISRPHTALLTQQPSVHSVRDNLPGCSIAPYRERHIICIVLVLKKTDIQLRVTCK